MTARPNDPHIGLVVEGTGDKSALPLLLRRHLYSQEKYDDILGKPVPLKGRGAATRENGLEGYVVTAARPGCRGVIVVLDADKDKSCELGPSLLERVQSVVAIPVVIAIAERDFEDWIYCSVETLGIGASEWQESRRGLSAIEDLLAPNKYVKSTMQARLSDRVDIEVARGRSASFDRLLRKFDSLIASMPD